MISSIIKIGNSKGVRIPKPLLIESGLDKDIEIRAKKGIITIKAAPSVHKKVIKINDEAILSYKSLAKDWNNPSEDEAWKNLP